MAGIHKKLLEIQKAITVEKLGTLPDNKGGKMYFREEDVTAEVKKELNKHSIITAVRVKKAKHSTTFTGEGAGMRYRPSLSLVADVAFIDTEDGSEHVITVHGEGSDVGGDSSTPKALTQIRRMAFLHQFHISEPNSDTEGNAPHPGDNEETSVKAPSAIDFKGRINSGIKSKKVTSDEVNSAGDNLAPGVSRAEWMKDPAILSQVVTALGL